MLCSTSAKKCSHSLSLSLSLVHLVVIWHLPGQARAHTFCKQRGALTPKPGHLLTMDDVLC